MSLDKMEVTSKEQFTAALAAILLAVLKNPSDVSITSINLGEISEDEETKPADLYKKAAETVGKAEGRTEGVSKAFEAPYGQDREPVGYLAVLVKGNKVVHVIHGSEDEHRECVEKTIAKAKQSPMHILNTMQGVDLEVRPYFL